MFEVKELRVIESATRMDALIMKPKEFWGDINTISDNPFKNFYIAKIVITKTVQLLDKGFENNISLKKVKFDSFAYIGAMSFKNCRELQKVAGKYITYIGEEAFSKCPKLSKVILPNVKRIEANAFRDDINLELIDMPCLDYIGTGAFKGCSKLKVKCYPWQSVLFEDFFKKEQLIPATKEDIKAYINLQKENAKERKERGEKNL